ncbi:MAG: hypothetical protein JWO36_2744 [Myxococcales bacterium]|nr:hypothetical protein [Myxococcales bacterium]
MKAAALTVLAGLCACVDLPAIEPGCGNGILEPGEVCDVRDAQCVACGWTCAHDSDCAAIPAPRDASAYRCGTDRQCHAPAGTLAGQTSAQPFAAQSVFVTDVDRDGYGDAVGLSAESLVTRFGDDAGHLDVARSTLTPVRAGASEVLDIDGDGALDVLVPARDGAVAYTSPHGAMSPFAFALSLNIPLQLLPRVLIPIDGKRIVALVDDPLGSGSLVGAVIDATQQSLTPVQITLCDPNLSAATFEPDSISVHDATGLDGERAVGFSFVATIGNQRKLCVMRVAEDLQPSPIAFHVAASTPFTAPATRAVIAQIENGACPALVFSDLGPGALTYLPGILDASNRCTLSLNQQTLPAIPGPPGDAAVGVVRLVPAISGVAPDALVMASGIYGIGAAAAVPYYISDRPLTHVAYGDVDGDHIADAVATGTDQTIDVLYRTSSPTAFTRVRLPTNATPSHLSIGDFDGNGIADIAYVEPLNSGQALQIAYGTHDRPLPAIEVADFTKVEDLVRVSLLDSSDRDGHVDDFGVVDVRVDPLTQKSAPVVVVFHGSADRAMIPFVDPRGTNPGSSFGLVAGGHFQTGKSSLDLFMLEVPDAIRATAPAMAWRMAGAGPGALYQVSSLFPSESGFVQVSDTGRPTFGSCTMPLDSVFCANQARLVTWPTSGPDQVIAIDPTKAQAIVIQPASFDVHTANAAITVEPIPVPGLPTMARLRATLVADLDRDGADELVIAYEVGDTEHPTGSILVCTPSTSTIACTDLVAMIPELVGRSCTDLVPGHVGEARFVVQCGSELHAVAHDADGYHATYLVGVVNRPEAIAAGDVTGDGVDDVLALASDLGGVRRLFVYRQLTAREVGR